MALCDAQYDKWGCAEWDTIKGVADRKSCKEAGRIMDWVSAPSRSDAYVVSAGDDGDETSYQPGEYLSIFVRTLKVGPVGGSGGGLDTSTCTTPCDRTTCTHTLFTSRSTPHSQFQTPHTPEYHSITPHTHKLTCAPRPPPSLPSCPSPRLLSLPQYRTPASNSVASYSMPSMPRVRRWASGRLNPRATPSFGSPRTVRMLHAPHRTCMLRICSGLHMYPYHCTTTRCVVPHTPRGSACPSSTYSAQSHPPHFLKTFCSQVPTTCRTTACILSLFATALCSAPPRRAPGRSPSTPCSRWARPTWASSTGPRSTSC